MLLPGRQQQRGALHGDLHAARRIRFPPPNKTLRRWRGALLPSEAKISFETIDYEKRPVSAMADTLEVKNVIKVHVSSFKKVFSSI